MRCAGAGDQMITGAEFFIANPDPAVGDEIFLDLVMVVREHLAARGHVPHGGADAADRLHVQHAHAGADAEPGPLMAGQAALNSSISAIARAVRA